MAPGVLSRSPSPEPPLSVKLPRPKAQKLVAEIVKFVPSTVNYTELTYEEVEPEDGLLVARTLAEHPEIERRTSSKVRNDKVKGWIEVWGRGNTGSLLIRELVVFPKPDPRPIEDSIRFTKQQLFGEIPVSNPSTVLPLEVPRLREIAEKILPMLASSLKVAIAGCFYGHYYDDGRYETAVVWCKPRVQPIHCAFP
ncbi:hypothetical protein RIB2604_02002750 [Aspergillus luchuensis]|uniref:Uncharacterized protein n=1 Tax=Aspergillus kawachii TaxID=1069201 RepID=A0A146FIY4_ASPKA|nr:hypothetical protein RIB2604_02002750 [Aspergillus luchuensis]